MKYPENIPAVETRTDVSADEIAECIVGRAEPMLFKGAAAHWPMVSAAKAGKLSDYLAPFDQGRPLVVFRAGAETGGRIFYNERMDGFNFERTAGQLLPTMRALESYEFGEECCYVGSTPVDHHLPGLRDANDISMGEEKPLVSLWFGNRTRVAAHFDLPENLACVVAGRRRFTLFPPEQVSNLYPGPLDFNPAGQSISMVDFYNPIFDQFPKYRDALASAQVAEVYAGDVLYVPSMWWHQVEGLDSLNVLVNYWWRCSPAWSGLPHEALMHSLLSIGTLPIEQRRAWGGLFRHFVVEREEANAHIPSARQGVLGRMDRDTSARIKNMLLEALRRYS
ncbi:cupin-like domain-containing protein [Microbulbifer agarilyticus]